MALTLGTRLGVYDIIAPIGEGGMGQVFRARDTRLDRDVAIKILPEAFAHDADRLARFTREAKTLASLNHPNIAGIYGLEESGGVSALVMELVEGDDLSQRIAKGAIPIDEALPVAKQIAEALEAAHEQGIVHRDLKPANIKVRPDGTVKVLDFGLAKAMEPGGASTVMRRSRRRYRSTPPRPGSSSAPPPTCLPSRPRGKAVDQRSDVWAFGVVLYEMLAGIRAFRGDEISDTIVSVLRDDPDWSRLPADTPPGVVQALRVCLRKDPMHRLRDISTVRLAMEGAFNPIVASTATPEGVAVHGRATSSILWKAAVALLALTTLAGVAAAYRALSATSPVVRFSVTPPEKTSFVTHSHLPATSVTISPDGKALAFTAEDGARKTLVWVRPIDSVAARPLPGTEDAALPFWSPDSRFIGYTAAGKLMKIAVGGGPPQMVSTLNAGAVNGRGATWGLNDVIVFNAGPGPLIRISSSGGQSTAFTKEAGTFPSFLPDGRHVLFYYQGAAEGPGVYVVAIEGGEPKRLVAADSGGVYSARSGHLLFVRQGTLLAQPFNPTTQALADEAFPIAEHVEAAAVPGLVSFSVSNTGVLAYGTGVANSAGIQLVWIDRQGKQVGTVGSAGNYRGLDLLADGARVAAHRHDGDGGDIWLMDLSGGTESRFTFDPSQHNSAPISSPDGSQVAFGSLRAGKWGLYRKQSNNAASDERLIESDAQLLPVSWAPDGQSIVYESSPPLTASDLWTLPLTGNGKPAQIVHTQFVESRGQVSPDGKWLAYDSTETGRTQVYVQAFPSGVGKWQVSVNGGLWARWRPDGRELFYVTNPTGGQLVAVDVRASGTSFEWGRPRELFEVGLVNAPHTRYHAYAVSSDGQRFLIPRRTSPVATGVDSANCCRDELGAGA